MHNKWFVGINFELLACSRIILRNFSGDSVTVKLWLVLKAESEEQTLYFRIVQTRGKEFVDVMLCAF